MVLIIYGNKKRTKNRLKITYFVMTFNQFVWRFATFMLNLYVPTSECLKGCVPSLSCKEAISGSKFQQVGIVGEENKTSATLEWQLQADYVNSVWLNIWFMFAERDAWSLYYLVGYSPINIKLLRPNTKKYFNEFHIIWFFQFSCQLRFSRVLPNITKTRSEKALNKAC